MTPRTERPLVALIVAVGAGYLGVRVLIYTWSSPPSSGEDIFGFVLGTALGLMLAGAAIGAVRAIVRGSGPEQLG